MKILDVTLNYILAVILIRSRTLYDNAYQSASTAELEDGVTMSS